MEKSSIEDRFTLPRRRKACREGDAVVDAETYRAAQIAEQIRKDKSLKLDDIHGIEIEVARGKTAAKAALASSLRPHNIEQGFKDRVNRVAERIADAVITELDGWDIKDCVDFIADASKQDEWNEVYGEDFLYIKIPAISFSEKDCSTDPASSENRRENFMHELKKAVEERIFQYLIDNVFLAHKGQSIWDIYRPVVTFTDEDEVCINVSLTLGVQGSKREEELS